MYPTLDVQTSLTFARLHQDDVRAAFPSRRRARTWLPRRTDETALAPPQILTPPARGATQHQPAAA
ncbi:MAG TPA: hypothetical protein VFI99_00675 [Nocardioides sp.]|jgi:hypothetical protein|nr:hypothetical protein [Nocardioides sp.]